MRESFIRANYFGADGRFRAGGFCIENETFARVGDVHSGTDLGGAYVIPGLIDVHTHGGAGYDFSTCSAEELALIAQAHAKAGLAGFCPTSMALPEEDLARAFANAADLNEHPPEAGASLLGINMEGPYLALARQGAQNPIYLKKFDLALFERLYEAARGHIAFVDVAPELDGALDFIEAVKGRVIVSLAHSDADYEASLRGFDAGVSHVTHLFNAMPGLNHRNPGPIGAAADRGHVKVELIADGVHIHPSVVRLCFKLFGADRICLVSDSIEACGLEDGAYSLGGQSVLVKGARAELADGTIAGSVTPLYRCMQNAMRWGVAKEDAVRAATLTPAGQLGLLHRFGSISTGAEASFIIADEAFNIRGVYLRGQRLERAGN